MNKSELLIIVSIAVVLTLSAVIIAVPAQNDRSAVYGDLTILDSDENIVQGLTLTYKIHDSDGKGYADAKTVVTEVDGNNVKFTNTYKGRWNNETNIELDSFSKSEAIFDYTDSSEIPEGVTVKKEGDSYRINGGFTEEFGSDYTKYTFKDLIITLDNTEAVISVSGQITDEYVYTIDEGNYEKFTDVYTYKTNDSVLYADWEFEGSSYCDITKDGFFEESVIYALSMDDYQGATITESSAKLGSLPIEVYTVNGEVGGVLTEKYEDYKVYVYGKYIISVSGKIDGDEWRADITVKTDL